MTHQVSSTEKLRVITRRDLPVGTQAVQAALFNFSTYLYNMQIRYTTESFINKASILHNQKYDYSVTQYVNSKSKLKILCSIHGVFEQIPHHHYHQNQINHQMVSVIEEMERKLENLSIPKGFSLRPILIHVNGVSQAVTETEVFNDIVDFSKFFE